MILNKVILFIKSYILKQEINTNSLGINKSLIPPIESIYAHLKYLKFTKITAVKFESTLYPIFEFRNNNNPEIIIFWGIHGNETSSFTSIEKIADIVEKSIALVGPINPTGYVLDKRGTADGVDPNRNLYNKNSIETSIQLQVLEKYNPKLVISLHEGPQDGLLFINETKTEKSIVELALSKIDDSMLSTRNIFGQKLKQKGVWNKSRIYFYLQKIVKLNSLGAICDSKGINCITVEVDWKLELREREKMQEIAIKSLLI